MLKTSRGELANKRLHLLAELAAGPLVAIENNVGFVFDPRANRVHVVFMRRVLVERRVVEIRKKAA